MTASGRKSAPPLVLAAIAAATLGCGDSAGRGLARANADQGAVPVDVVVVTATKEDLDREVVLAASVEAFESTTVFSRVSGYVGRIEVDIGDRVGKNQPVATIEVPEIEDQLRQAEAELAVRQADRESAEAELERLEATSRLRALTFERVSSVRADEPDVISRQAVDEADAEADVAAAAVRAARGRIRQIDGSLERAAAEIDRLRTLVGFSTLRAPFPGVVTDRHVHTGALLEGSASAGAANGIVTVSSLDRVRLLVDVPESDVPHVQVGDPAVVEVDAMPGRQFRGAVSRFATVLDPSARTMRAEIHLPNPRWQLRPGMFGRARLTLDVVQDAVTVPAEAVRIEGAGSFVYRVAGGRAVRTEVQTSIGDGIRVRVREGLSGGEKVVVSARGPLSDGVAVRAAQMQAGDRP